MLSVRLLSQLSDETIERRKGGDVTYDDIAMLPGPTENVAVYKANGQPLAVVLRKAIPQEMIDASLPGLMKLKQLKSDNRSVYQGKNGEGPKFKIKADGTVSNSRRVLKPDGSKSDMVASAIAGYFDPTPRHPFCRQTAFTANYVEKWKPMQPMLRRAAELFKEHLPQRYATQMEHVKHAHPDFVIQGTPFSTVTVNHNAVAKLHIDKGDLPNGFGVLSVVKIGQYKGFELVFPKYKFGASLDTGDVILFDPHEYHANIAPYDQSPDAHRISVVYYFRRRISECTRNAADEAKFAASKQGSFVMEEGAVE